MNELILSEILQATVRSVELLTGTAFGANIGLKQDMEELLEMCKLIMPVVDRLSGDGRFKMHTKNLTECMREALELCELLARKTPLGRVLVANAAKEKLTRLRKRIETLVGIFNLANTFRDSERVEDSRRPSVSVHGLQFLFAFRAV